MDENLACAVPEDELWSAPAEQPIAPQHGGDDHHGGHHGGSHLASQIPLVMERAHVVNEGIAAGRHGVSVAEHVHHTAHPELVSAEHAEVLGEVGHALAPAVVIAGAAEQRHGMDMMENGEEAEGLTTTIEGGLSTASGMATLTQWGMSSAAPIVGGTGAGTTEVALAAGMTDLAGMCSVAAPVAASGALGMAVGHHGDQETERLGLIPDADVASGEYTERRGFRPEGEAPEHVPSLSASDYAAERMQHTDDVCNAAFGGQHPDACTALTAMTLPGEAAIGGSIALTSAFVGGLERAGIMRIVHRPPAQRQHGDAPALEQQLAQTQPPTDYAANYCE